MKVLLLLMPFLLFAQVPFESAKENVLEDLYLRDNFRATEVLEIKSAPQFFIIQVGIGDYSWGRIYNYRVAKKDGKILGRDIVDIWENKN